MLELLAQKPKSFRKTSDDIYYEYNQWPGLLNLNGFEYGPINNNKEQILDDEWFIRFIRKYFPNNKTRINFFGPLSTPFLIRKKMPGVKVFYTPEDVDKFLIKLNIFYGRYCLDQVDFAMGFKDMVKDKYLRVPYWIITTFSPTLDENGIINRIDDINNRQYHKTESCALVCGHDKKGTREMILRDVEQIMDVKIAGRWHNNTKELHEVYGNNKYKFLQKFKFNICAENDNTVNYVTEKLFDAFLSGTVPIYYGSDNKPEPKIINYDAVIFWNKNGDNKKNMELLEYLNNNDKAYEEFIRQPRLLPYAKEYMIEKYFNIRENFKRILE